ncbi:MAG TPA: HupE/UreJ family protein [Rhodoferax sp.]|nr:HupE/UreJ family protein [Rhodoferax sp.]
MKFISVNVARLASLAVLLLATGAAQAHTGHGTSGVLEGLVHPFGLDHLLAMVAVGVWSVSALPASQAWRGPAMFMLALVVSAALGAAGVSVPFLEQLISLSVVLFGLMLVFSRSQIPAAFGLCLVALAASLHGVAHGAETPETGFATYAAGFLLTTAALHFGGVLAGLGVRRWLASRASLAVSGFGILCGGAGLYLFSQI